MNSSHYRLAFAIILSSFLVCGFIHILEIGLENTPYETRDSSGRSMGFNDPFSLEHYEIMARHFEWKDLVVADNWYSWILLFSHAIGFVVIAKVGTGTAVWTRWYFAGQWFVFPLGLVALPFFPSIIHSILGGTLDREGVIDPPLLVYALNHPIWCIAASLTFFVLRKGLRDRDTLRRAA